MMEHSKTNVILKVEHVSLRYDKLILRDIDFEVHNIVRKEVTQGQVISLIGRSGIGKTCLFRILAGLIQPTSGSVKIDDDLHPVQAGEVGVVYQNYILFNHRTVYDNLRLAVERNKQYEGAKAEEVIKEYAQHFSLAEHLKKYPQQLSGGQKQRVSIIQQVLTGNRFILLDEPFSGLDVLMIDKVKEVLLKISTMHEYNTLIIVSHDIKSALSISDCAYILSTQSGQEGAVVSKYIDLIELGFAWDPEVLHKPAFHDFAASIKTML